MDRIINSPDYSQTSYYKKAIDDVETQSKEESKRTRQLQREELDRAKRAYTEDLIKKTTDSEEVIQKMSDSQSDTLARIRNDAAVEKEAIKASYNKKGELTVPREVYVKQIEDLSKAVELRRQTDNKVADDIRNGLQADINAVQRRAGEQIYFLTNQQEHEVHNKNEEVKALIDYNKEADAKRTEATAEYERHADSKLKTETKRLTDTYERNLTNLKQSGGDREEYYTQANRDLIKSKEAITAERFKTVNQENLQQRNELQNTFATQIARLREQRESEIEKNSKTLRDQVDRSNHFREEALTQQSKDYRDSLDNVRKAANEKIETLQKSLQNVRTSADTSLVSPAAEESIRRPIVANHHKLLQKEVERSKGNLETMQEKYARNFRERVQEFDDRTAATAEETNRDRASEKNQYLGTIGDIEYNTNQKLREQTIDHDRENEQLTKEFGILLDRQRREYDHIFEAAKSEAAIRMSNYRAETESASRMMQREARVHQNELIRDYEKKLAEQKRSYDVIIEDMKTAAQVATGEMERKNKHDIEDLSRGFEQRIAQLQSQSKERERTIVEAYQDELDKTRHSYETQARRK